VALALAVKDRFSPETHIRGLASHWPSPSVGWAPTPDKGASYTCEKQLHFAAQPTRHIGRGQDDLGINMRISTKADSVPIVSGQHSNDSGQGAHVDVSKG
jgi:hypothetical protein